MKFSRLHVLCLLIVPGLAWAQDPPAPTPPELAVQGITSRFQTPAAVRGLQLSGSEKRGTEYRFCATTDAFNHSGHAIGYTYWEVIVNEDPPEVVSVRDVTGLFSDCYSAGYKPYKP